MNEDFNLNLNIEDDEENQNEKFPSKMEKEEIKEYKRLKEDMNNNDLLVEFISPKKYYRLKKLFRKNKNKYTKKEEEKGLENIIKKKMEKIIDNYFSTSIYAAMQNQIISLGIEPNKNNRKKILDRLEEMKKNLKGIGNPLQAIIDFGEKINKIYNYEPNDKTVCEIKNNYNIISDYFKNTSSIKYLLIGPHN